MPLANQAEMIGYLQLEGKWFMDSQAGAMNYLPAG